MKNKIKNNITDIAIDTLNLRGADINTTRKHLQILLSYVDEHRFDQIMCFVRTVRRFYFNRYYQHETNVGFTVYRFYANVDVMLNYLYEDYMTTFANSLETTLNRFYNIK